MYICALPPLHQRPVSCPYSREACAQKPQAPAGGNRGAHVRARAANKVMSFQDTPSALYGTLLPSIMQNHHRDAQLRPQE